MPLPKIKKQADLVYRSLMAILILFPVIRILGQYLKVGIILINWDGMMQLGIRSIFVFPTK
ncbi:hypothetical protein EF405_11685 [Cyclobacteriaceae bacterium YHN15]|nr:hypothetical protein EF405_11685 [Cyclobacteriaceae bacterium YHN15]